LGINYGGATPTYVLVNGEEMLYSARMQDYVLAGKVVEKWDKIKAISDYLERIEWEGKIIFVDDNKVKMLEYFKNRGVEVYLYFSAQPFHEGNRKYAQQARELGIPVVNSLLSIVEAVSDS